MSNSSPPTTPALGPIQPETAAGTRLGPAYRIDRNGWHFVHVAGNATERGWMQGWLLAAEIRAAIASITQLIWMDTATPFSWWAANARAMWYDRLTNDHDGQLAGTGPLILQELEGIVAGANARYAPGPDWLTIEDLLGWNGYPEMICQWYPAVLSGGIKPLIPLPPQQPASGAKPASSPRSPLQSNYFIPHHCSAFIATGEWTADGGIVAAHTTWQRFANGDFYNVILDIDVPASEGYGIQMQTAPGYVASSMDFGQNDAGIVAISTSINGSGFLVDGMPYFFRARRAGQFADRIESWVSLFRQGNNGGYTNSWLLGEAKTRRIAAYELTASNEELQPILTSGYYSGYNIPLSDVIRAQIGGQSVDNILYAGGSRHLRFEQLLNHFKGRIEATIAREVLADHYDVYSRATEPSSRTICGHYDIDNDSHNTISAPFYPFGSLDGKVTTASLASRGAIEARWGRACGMPFEAEKFFSEHAQFSTLRHLTMSRPSQPWTHFPVTKGS